MRKAITIIALITLLLIAGCATQQNIKTVSYNDETVSETTLITQLLESRPYNYEVISVEEDYEQVLGNYAKVVMYAEGTETELYSQLGAGYGAMYGAWEDEKDYYMVGLVTEEVCMFGVDSEVLKKFLNDEINEYELMGNIITACT